MGLENIDHYPYEVESVELTMFERRERFRPDGELDMFRTAHRKTTENRAPIFRSTGYSDNGNVFVEPTLDFSDE